MIKNLIYVDFSYQRKKKKCIFILNYGTTVLLFNSHTSNSHT